MADQQKATLLRVFVGELDQFQGHPVYEAIVQAAMAAGLAGATVLRGIESFGASRQLHTAKVLRLAEDLPLVVEIVDSEEKITAFLEPLAALLEAAGEGALVTLEAVRVLRFAPRKKG